MELWQHVIPGTINCHSRGMQSLCAGLSENTDSGRYNGSGPDGSEKADPEGAAPVQISADPHPAGRYRGAGEQCADPPEDGLNKQKQPWPDGRGCCPLFCPLRFSTDQK